VCPPSSDNRTAEPVWVSLYCNRINDGVRASHRRVAGSVLRSIDRLSVRRDNDTVGIKGKTAIIAGATSGLAIGGRGDHSGLLLPEVADRQAIRELVDAYARCADRCDAAGQMALFTEDVDFVVYDRGNPVPTHKLRGRAALAPICQRLKAFHATMHMNGQSTTRIDGPRASGVTCSLVHYLTIDGTTRTVMTSAIHYLDSYVKRDGAWLIRQRQVMIHWSETRTLTTG
jgi:uncharacterized protein (TIGR02246 family)